MSKRPARTVAVEDPDADTVVIANHALLLVANENDVSAYVLKRKKHIDVAISCAGVNREDRDVNRLTKWIREDSVAREKGQIEELPPDVFYNTTELSCNLVVVVFI